MKVRLTRKLAESLDGVDLSGRAVGEIMDCGRHDAEMLIAEGWAVSVVSDIRRAARSARRRDRADEVHAPLRPSRKRRK